MRLLLLQGSLASKKGVGLPAHLPPSLPPPSPYSRFPSHIQAMSTVTTNMLDTPTKGKKNRPKSPRRKAPSAPKKKTSDAKAPPPSSDKSKPRQNGPSKDLLNTPEGNPLEKEKSMKRSVSPRTDGYSSLLDEMVGMGDMVLLDPITEDSVLQNLTKRYSAGEIYVSVERQEHCMTTHLRSSPS